MQADKFNQCLERIRCGDSRGISAIYEEYYERITFTALRRLHNLEAAKDVASDMIKYLLEKADMLGTIRNPNAWIYKCADNMAINAIRKESWTTPLSEFAEDAFIESRNDDVYFCMVDAFEQLNLDEVEIILLHFVFGFKYREMSEMLNMPVGTIKSRVHAIRPKFKKFFM